MIVHGKKKMYFMVMRECSHVTNAYFVCGVSLPLSPRCFLIIHFRTLVSYKDDDLLCVPRSGCRSNFALSKNIRRKREMPRLEFEYTIFARYF